MSVTAVPLPPLKRSYSIWLWFGLIVAALVAVGFAWCGTATSVAEKGSNEQFLAWHRLQLGVKTTASGLQYQILKPGDGPSPTDQDVALVEYVGKLRDGRVFDQSRQPTPLPVAGMIPGFTEGLKLMPKGAKYRFWIKPELGYGEHTPDPEVLPADSILVFDVELKNFMPMAQFQQLMRMQQGAAGAGAPPPPSEH